MNTIILINEDSNCLKTFFGRPFLEHVIESLIKSYIGEIHIFCNENSEIVENTVGKGEKWGIKLHHHRTNSTDLSQIIVNKINVKNMSMVVNPDFILKPRYKYVEFDKDSNTLFFTKGRYTGWGLLPPGFFKNTTFKNSRELTEILCNMKSITEEIPDYLSVINNSEWLSSANKIITKKHNGIIMKCRETGSGIFKGRNTSIGKSTVINAPVYIGDNSIIGNNAVIGPFATIGKNCRIDSKAVIENSLVDNNSYIGRSVDIKDSVIYGNNIFNAELSSEISISDKFLVSNFLQDSIL